MKYDLPQEKPNPLDKEDKENEQPEHEVQQGIPQGLVLTPQEFVDLLNESVVIHEERAYLQIDDQYIEIDQELEDLKQLLDSATATLSQNIESEPTECDSSSDSDTTQEEEVTFR
jgi:hypothetical protein